MARSRRVIAATHRAEPGDVRGDRRSRNCACCLAIARAPCCRRRHTRRLLTSCHTTHPAHWCWSNVLCWRIATLRATPIAVRALRLKAAQSGELAGLLRSALTLAVPLAAAPTVRSRPCSRQLCSRRLNRLFGVTKRLALTMLALSYAASAAAAPLKLKFWRQVPAKSVGVSASQLRLCKSTLFKNRRARRTAFSSSTSIFF